MDGNPQPTALPWRDPGPGSSCVSPTPQLKREWSPWPEFRLDFRKSVRPFKGIFCDDVSEFESHMPSHAVRSLWAMSDLQGTTFPSQWTAGAVMGR
jgi:hypothetical protein